jgi:hypothetical protein
VVVSNCLDSEREHLKRGYLSLQVGLEEKANRELLRTEIRFFKVLPACK